MRTPGLFKRAHPEPPRLRRQLAPHERLLAVADTPGSVLAATQLGLWLPTGPQDWRRLSWNAVVLATWTDAGLEIIEGVTDDDGVVSDLPAVGYVLIEPRNLPMVLRQRVEASIARWEQIRVPGGTARLVARKVPGQDGLSWTGRLDNSAQDSPEARAVIIANLQAIAARAAAQADQF